MADLDEFAEQAVVTTAVVAVGVGEGIRRLLDEPRVCSRSWPAVSR